MPLACRTPKEPVSGNSCLVFLRMGWAQVQISFSACHTYMWC
jgi:hypothetical protein